MYYICTAIIRMIIFVYIHTYHICATTNTPWCVLCPRVVLLRPLIIIASQLGLNANLAVLSAVSFQWRGDVASMKASRSRGTVLVHSPCMRRTIDVVTGNVHWPVGLNNLFTSVTSSSISTTGRGATHPAKSLMRWSKLVTSEKRNGRLTLLASWSQSKWVCPEGRNDT